MRRFIRLLIIILFYVICAYARAEEGKINYINIAPQEKWRAVFGGRECIYHFQVNAAESITGRAGWQLSYANRTIASGESAFKAGPEEKGFIEIHINVPPVNEGVMMPAQLSVALFNKHELASWSDTLYIYSKDPFVLKKEWLKGLKIGLFDPEKKTGKIFEELGIPFIAQTNIDAFSEFKGSLFVVGSGVDFAEFRTLWKVLLNLSARGVDVLVLEPGGGTVGIPRSEGAMFSLPEGISLRQNEVIHKLNKKLDKDAWPPDGKAVACGMMLKAGRVGVMGEFVAGNNGWPWVEIDFGEKGGKNIVCGFGIMDRINDGPTPRFLLAQIFEYMVGGAE